MSIPKKPKKENLKFEVALEELEAIVNSMEEGGTMLEELVAKFEEGDALLKFCNQQLKAAELKIEKLKENSEDQFEPFEND